MSIAFRHRPCRTALLLGPRLQPDRPAWAAKPKEDQSFLDHKKFHKKELVISSSNASLAEILPALSSQSVRAWDKFLASDEARNSPGGVQAFLDPRSGAATNIVGSFPLIPGDGVGNQMTLQELGQRLGRELREVDAAAVEAVARDFVTRNAAVLGIDSQHLADFRAEQANPHLWQVTAIQKVGGLAVRHARLVATISHGNLVMVGTESWGTGKLKKAKPDLTSSQALATGFTYVGGSSALDVMLRAPALEIVPIAPPELQEGEKYKGPVGKGYGYRLVWSFVFQRPPDDARWEILVDANSSEVLALEDLNLYADRQFSGGVYPMTATGICPTQQTCGTMQSGWPMPFADTGFAAPNNFTDSAGVYNYTSGTATTTLTGRYVDINDNCGAINASSASGAINLGGTNNQHDCTTPGSGGAGNTPASRSAFYEVNKLAEQGRGWLPSNTWLQTQLDVNVNLNQTCNAFWNGSTINFYRSGGGCRNTGELAGVFDHEWGHGLDDNDTGGGLSNSSEAYADIAANYRLNASCVGHGFFATLNDGCGQTADGTGFNSNEAQQGAAHCDTDCSGVRDSDYLKHVPNTPDTALGFVCTSCITGTGPCGRQVHCAAAPVRQMAWDLVKRDLTAAPFNYDTQTALLVGTKLFYQGSGSIGSWHSCTCGSASSGCGATNGYMQWLAADDDNGNVNDGTPHMTAIHAAYNRHGIACATPAPVNSGCSGQPNGGTGPTLSATPGDSQVALSWSAVGGAARYWVMRTEGHAGPEFGKTRIADITGTSFTDVAVANGRTYWYNIVAQGTSAACYSRVSNAVEATPAGSVTPDFSVSCSPSSLTVSQGGSTTSTCTVTSTNGFASAVTLSCTGMPSGSSCGFSPNPVTPPANGSVNSTLTVSATATAATGSFSFQVQGVGGSLTRTFGMSLSVNPVGGGGDEIAVFDATLQAPKCANVGRSCDTGPNLVKGRDNMAGGGSRDQPAQHHQRLLRRRHLRHLSDRRVLRAAEGGVGRRHQLRARQAGADRSHGARLAGRSDLGPAGSVPGGQRQQSNLDCGGDQHHSHREPGRHPDLHRDLHPAERRAAGGAGAVPLSGHRFELHLRRLQRSRRPGIRGRRRAAGDHRVRGQLHQRAGLDDQPQRHRHRDHRRLAARRPAAHQLERRQAARRLQRGQRPRDRPRGRRGGRRLRHRRRHDFHPVAGDHPARVGHADPVVPVLPGPRLELLLGGLLPGLRGRRGDSHPGVPVARRGEQPQRCLDGGHQHQPQRLCRPDDPHPLRRRGRLHGQPGRGGRGRREDHAAVAAARFASAPGPSGPGAFSFWSQATEIE